MVSHFPYPCELSDHGAEVKMSAHAYAMVVVEIEVVCKVYQLFARFIKFLYQFILVSSQKSYIYINAYLHERVFLLFSVYCVCMFVGESVYMKILNFRCPSFVNCTVCVYFQRYETRNAKSCFVFSFWFIINVVILQSIVLFVQMKWFVENYLLKINFECRMWVFFNLESGTRRFFRNVNTLWPLPKIMWTFRWWYCQIEWNKWSWQKIDVCNISEVREFCFIIFVDIRKEPKFWKNEIIW